MGAGRRGKRYPYPVVALGVLAIFLFACEGRPVTVTRLVEVTRMVTAAADAESDASVATRLVVVTATPPAPANQADGFAAEDPTHFRAYVPEGPLTLDPAQAMDPGSRQVVQNVVEPLLLPSPSQPDRFLPLLATRWLSDESGLSYTFQIRPDVVFSNGNSLTAGDVAYTLQRGILQSVPGTPFSLLVGPLLGYPSADVTEGIAGGDYAGDRDALLAGASERDLRTTCEQVKEAISADDAAGTVTLALAEPWAPLPAALSQPWTGIIDQEWASAQDAWDGSCETWAAWYAPEAGASALATALMGTGPFILDHWTPGVEYTLVSNEDYWRQAQAPLGPSGRVGAPALKTVSVYHESDATARWQALRAGEAETAALPPETQLLASQWVGEICSWPSGQCRPSENANNPLRQHTGLLLPERSALFFNFDITVDANPFIGSGQLDGDGVPANFFLDEHVRRAFAYCLDEERLIESALHGNGRAASSIFPADFAVTLELPAPTAFDPSACAEELASAWDGSLPETGLWIQVPIEAGNTLQLQVSLLLQEALREANASYRVEIVGLASGAYRDALTSGKLPLALISWTPYLPDPHSWMAPAFGEDVTAFQRLPSDLEERFTTLLDQGVTTLAADDRMAAYRTLEIERRESVPHILLPAATGDRYEQRWVQNWLSGPLLSEPYFYAYSLRGD